MKIHLIEKDKRIIPVDKPNHSYSSGYWIVSRANAKALIGGDIYFHKAQDKPSYFGGKITSYKYEEGGEWDGKVVFTFTMTKAHKEVRAGRSGWGMERKLVRDEEVVN